MEHRAPTFQEAKNRRQKVRAAGMNPNYWYAVAHSKEVPVGKVHEVVFWGRSFAIFRGEDGVVRAVENRCAHRQLKLTVGEVRGCNVVCPYHGWSFDGDGKLIDVPHELFGQDIPQMAINAYATRERYGLIWLFPGDPERAHAVAMPEIPELEGPDRWACEPVSLVWKAHHSMILDNICDFTHGYLHRKYTPFKDPKLTNVEVKGEQIFVEYDTKVGEVPIFGHLVDRKRAKTNHMKLCFEYPHQWSNTDEWIRHWCFVLPIDERTTKVFFLFYYKNLTLPGSSRKIPRRVMKPLLKIANRALMLPILAEDAFAIEAEQEGYDKHFDAPIAELNPVVKEFQDLTIRKWQEYLDEYESHPKRRRLPLSPLRCPGERLVKVKKRRSSAPASPPPASP